MFKKTQKDNSRTIKIQLVLNSNPEYYYFVTFPWHTCNEISVNARSILRTTWKMRHKLSIIYLYKLWCDDERVTIICILPVCVADFCYIIYRRRCVQFANASCVAVPVHKNCLDLFCDCDCVDCWVVTVVMIQMNETAIVTDWGLKLRLRIMTTTMWLLCDVIDNNWHWHCPFSFISVVVINFKTIKLVSFVPALAHAMALPCPALALPFNSRAGWTPPKWLQW